MNTEITMYTLFGAIAVGIVVYSIHIKRKNSTLRQLENNARDQQTQMALLQERLEQISQQNAHNLSLLNTANTQIQQSTTELATLKQDLNHKSLALTENAAAAQALKQQIEALRLHDNQQQNILIKLQTEHEQMQQTSTEKLALLEDAKTKLALEFKELANQIFEEKQSKMTASSKETLDAILKPMQKDITEFRSRIEQVHKEDTEARGSLERHLSHLKELNQQISKDANNLTHALKSDSKAQGNWGEMILEKILISSGLREGKDFKREQTFTEEGNRQRPDVVVYLPDNKHIIIDSKVSLKHYEQALNAKDKITKQAAMKQHLQSMKKHIQTLHEKRYDQIDLLNSPDYTLMFMPIEAAYMMAIEEDSSIFEDAFGKNVAVVTPSTLYATLKLVEQLWRYEKQSDNVVKLINQAGKLHDKVVGFIVNFEDIGSRLEQAQKSYSKALSQLSKGPGNVVTQVKTLGTLSGKAKKELPAHLLDEDSEQAINSNIGEQS